MTDVAETARRLTKAQREAMLDARLVEIGHYPARWEVKTPRVWRALVDKGLAFSAGSQFWTRSRTKDRAVLNEEGLAVRDYLKGQAHDN